MLTNKSLLLANELNDLQPEAAGMMDVTLVTDFFFFQINSMRHSDHRLCNSLLN